MSSLVGGYSARVGIDRGEKALRVGGLGRFDGGDVVDQVGDGENRGDTPSPGVLMFLTMMNFSSWERSQMKEECFCRLVYF